MGERVEFPSNGHTCQGYFAGKGPGIVVIQEWWGLVPHIEEIVDRFARRRLLRDRARSLSRQDDDVAR